MSIITHVHAREILDSQQAQAYSFDCSVEVEVTQPLLLGRSSLWPATGSHEAVERPP